MAIGCDPELRLSLGGGSSGSDAAPSHRQMTIFYSGKVCVYDVTEVQARVILSMAMKEREDLAMKKKNKKSTEQEETVESAAAQPRLQILSPPAGLSMKRSLQRFLQKRKARISDASPYSQKPKLPLFPINSQEQE